MPYALSGLSDASETIQKMMWSTLNEIGRRHEEEHADELTDVLRFEGRVDSLTKSQLHLSSLHELLPAPFQGASNCMIVSLDVQLCDRV